MNAIPADILKTAAALMAMTEERGCTADEAATAAAKLIGLAERHGVTLEDLKDNLASQPDAVCLEDVPLGLGDRTFGRQGALILAGAVAVGFECRLLQEQRARGEFETVSFVGFKADVVCAAFAYRTILPRLVEKAEELGLGRKLTSFLAGAAASIHARLVKARRVARDSGNPAETGLVLREKKDVLIEESLRKRGVKKAPDPDLHLDPAAANAGAREGRNVELIKGIGKREVA